MNYLKIMRNLSEKITEVEVGINYGDIFNAKTAKWHGKAHKLFSKIVVKLRLK